MSVEKQEKNPRLSAWILATRPKTLPAAAAPVLVGTALAFLHGGFDFFPALAALLGALLLQIVSNIANDLYDFYRGADAGERLGPTRVTQAGLLTPNQVKRGLLMFIGLSALIGVYLVFHAGWPILVIGVAAILSALAYTAGPFPLGYHGLGDLFVFIFFGLAATAGTYFVQAGRPNSLVWWMSVAVGLLIVAILVVNNLRDIESDRLAGKVTLAVRLGESGTRYEYLLCILGAYVIPLVAWLLDGMPLGGLLVVVSIPLAWRSMQRVFTVSGRNLNTVLAATGRLSLVYAALFSVGIIFSTLW